MKSLSKVHSPASNKQLETWKITDLDVESNVAPAELQSEQILAFFTAGQKPASSLRDDGSHSRVHSNGVELSLTNWLPGDIDVQSDAATAGEWDFLDPTSDFFEIPEQQVWKEKFDSEKERIEIIKHARADAETILLEARAEAEKIILNAHAEVAQAKKEGYEAARDELQSALAATRAIVEETHEWQVSMMKNGEQTLMEMLKDIAQTIFGEGVRLDPDALQMNLNRIMDNAQRLGDLKIFINPEDANQLDPSWSNYQLLITGNKVRIVPSEKIKPGGCVIKGSTGMVDARVETQLAAVLNTIDEVNEVSK